MAWSYTASNPPKMLSTITIGIVSYLLYYLYRQRQARNELPPGPPPLPFLGNILDLPPSNEPEFQHWLKHIPRFGLISSVSVVNYTIVVLHDKSAAQDLLGSQSAISSDRPHLPYPTMCGYDELMAFQDDNAELKRRRRLFHQQMGTEALAARFDQVQQRVVSRLLLLMLRMPESSIEHIKSAIAAITLETTYGLSVTIGTPDPFVSLVEHWIERTSKMVVPTASFVNVFPVLKFWPIWMAGSGFKRQALDMIRLTDMIASIPYQFTLNQMKANQNSPSFVSNLVQQGADSGGSAPSSIHNEDIKAAATMMYLGATETTSASLKCFILAMMLFPRVQTKAQEAIDMLTRRTRLPTLEDQDKLPYVNALVKEILRWAPIFPLAFPHVMSREGQVGGYRIPKGAMVIPNIWWFTHDPAVYQDPDEFCPERFLTPRNEPDSMVFRFGYGRRTCPGRYMGERTIFLAASCILAMFNVSKQVGDNGVELEPELRSEPGISNHIADFPYQITPRSLAHAALVASEGKKPDPVDTRADFMDLEGIIEYMERVKLRT